MINVEEFSGGKLGVPAGACGLLTAIGDFKLSSIINSAACMQYRARTGAGVTIKGLYKDLNFYVFHIMYRDQHKVVELERLFADLGLRLLESQDMVARKYYYDYDLPIIKRYYVTPPSEDEMMYREKTRNASKFIKNQVTKFNSIYMDDARIFSSSKENGTFLTAFQLEDTVKIYDILQYEDRFYDACLIHLRWPTSRGRGLWWGPQPISLGEIAGIHNGHLSSDKANAQALEQLNIPMNVGTDSESIFLMTDYLIDNNYSIKEIEWVLCRKFPQEVAEMEKEEKEHYLSIINEPILRKMKMSGPATAIVLNENILLGFTDRDHLRSFSVGFNDKVAIMGSEQRAILSASYYLGEELSQLYDPSAGKIVGFNVENKIIEKLDYNWSKYGSKRAA
jgi:glutamate synthase domain-containing protein 1